MLQQERPTVLVVDDEPLVCKLLASQLTARGFNVRTASGGMEAFQSYLHDSDIDLVLTDICMPDLDGIQLVDLLRISGLNAPCCFITGHLGRYDGADLLRRASAIINKPFNGDDVARTLRNILRALEAATTEWVPMDLAGV